MKFAIIEGREENVGGHGDVLRKSDMIYPFAAAMEKDEVAITGEVEIGLEKALTEVVVEKKCLVRISIDRVKNAA